MVDMFSTLISVPEGVRELVFQKQLWPLIAAIQWVNCVSCFVLFFRVFFFCVCFFLVLELFCVCA